MNQPPHRSSSPHPALQTLLHLLGEAYDHKAWHGPNLRGLLRGVAPKQATFRVHPERHCIWELVLHCAYWKYTVTRHLTGDARGSFPRSGSNWLAVPAEASAAQWRADRALLDDQHQRLLRAVAALDDRDLARRPRGSRHTRARLVAGAAAHDLYHAGQVALLKRCCS